MDDGEREMMIPSCPLWGNLGSVGKELKAGVPLSPPITRREGGHSWKKYWRTNPSQRARGGRWVHADYCTGKWGEKELKEIIGIELQLLDDGERRKNPMALSTHQPPFTFIFMGAAFSFSRIKLFPLNCYFQAGSRGMLFGLVRSLSLDSTN